MSTRSKIGILRKDGTVDSAYCHWDGYPEHNGVILCESYNNINKVNELIKNGDMSLLEKYIYPSPGKPHSFDFNEERQENVCLFYTRDRGEDWKYTYPKTSKNLDRFKQECLLSDCEFAYIYDENKNDWFFSPVPYGKDSEMIFLRLKDELIQNNIEYNDSLKEDYLIYDGIELLKDLDYYEFRDNYNNNIEAYFSIKDMYDNKQFKDYINTVNSYIEEMDDRDLIDKAKSHLNELQEYFNLEEDLEI
jgi:hypothetical protein